MCPLGHVDCVRRAPFPPPPRRPCSTPAAECGGRGPVVVSPYPLHPCPRVDGPRVAWWLGVAAGAGGGDLPRAHAGVGRGGDGRPAPPRPLRRRARAPGDDRGAIASRRGRIVARVWLTHCRCDTRVVSRQRNNRGGGGRSPLQCRPPPPPVGCRPVSTDTGWAIGVSSVQAAVQSTPNCCVCAYDGGWLPCMPLSRGDSTPSCTLSPCPYLRTRSLGAV